MNDVSKLPPYEGSSITSASTTASATGVVGGTLLLKALLDLIPEEKYKQLVVLIVPSATIAIRFFFLWVAERLTNRADFWGKRLDLKSIEYYAETILSDTKIPEDTKQIIRESLDAARLNIIINGIDKISGKK